MLILTNKQTCVTDWFFTWLVDAKRFFFSSLKTKPKPWRETKDWFVLFSYLLTCLKLLKDLFEKWKFHFCLKIQKGNNMTLLILEAWSSFCSLWFSVQIVLVPQHLSPQADILSCPQGPARPSWGCVWHSLLTVSLILPPHLWAQPSPVTMDRTDHGEKQKKICYVILLWYILC